MSGWKLPTCGTPRDAIKRLEISKLPPMLVVHLKRFYVDPFSESFLKKKIFVGFPLTDMKMLPYMAKGEKNSRSNFKHIYILYAVSNHSGTMLVEGHYYGHFLLTVVLGFKQLSFFQPSAATNRTSGTSSTTAR